MKNFYVNCIKIELTTQKNNREIQTTCLFPMIPIYVPLSIKLNGIWSYWKFPVDYESNGIHLIQNQKGNFEYDHIPYNLQGSGNLFIRVSANIASGLNKQS